MDTDPRPFTYAPKGVGRPWYPKFTSDVVMTPTEDGVTLQVVGPVKRGRVGLRAWWRNLRAGAGES